MAQLVKTMAGLAIASVKTVNGLAIASVKTIAGLDNTSGGGFETPTYKNYLENAAAGSASNISATGTLNIAAGDLVVAYVAGTRTIASGTCGSDSMTVGVTRTATDGSGYYCAILYKENASANAAATITGTFSVGADFRDILVVQYSGIATASSLDQSSTDIVGNSGVIHSTSTARTAQNITTTLSNTLLLGFHLNWDNPRTTTAAAGYTKRGPSGSTMHNVCERVITSTGTYPSGNFATVDVTDPYLSIFAAFKAKAV